MSFFKKENIETSNKYYEAYKAEILTNQTEKENETLNNFLKIEVIIIVAALFVMNYNHITLTSKTNNDTLAMNTPALPVSVQSNDDDLIVDFEEEKNIELTIREEKSENSDETIASNHVTNTNEEIKLLIASLQSELEDTNPTTATNRIIISQK